MCLREHFDKWENSKDCEMSTVAFNYKNAHEFCAVLYTEN